MEGDNYYYYTPINLFSAALCQALFQVVYFDWLI